MDQLKTHYFASFKLLPLPHLSFPGQNKSPPHPLFVLRRKGLSPEDVFFFWLPGLDVTSGDYAVFGPVEGRKVRAWSWAGATMPYPYSKDQPVCKELMAPEEPQGPAA